MATQIMQEKAAKNTEIGTTVKIKVRGEKKALTDQVMYLASKRPTVRVQHAELDKLVLAVHQPNASNKAVKVTVLVDDRRLRYTAHGMYNKSVSAIIVDSNKTAYLTLTGVKPGSVVTVQFEEVVIATASGMDMSVFANMGGDLLGAAQDALGGLLGGTPAQPKRQKSTTCYKCDGRSGEIKIKILV